MSAPVPSKLKFFVNNLGQVVEVADETAETVRFSLHGGGFVEALPRAAFLATFKPTELPRFESVQVMAGWLPEGTTYPAFTNGQEWHGWVVPYFTFETGVALMGDMPNVSYSQIRDAFIAIEDHKIEGVQETIFRAENIAVEGSDVTVYGIGAGCWCWDLAEPVLH